MNLRNWELIGNICIYTDTYLTAEFTTNAYQYSSIIEVMY